MISCQSGDLAGGLEKKKKLTSLYIYIGIYYIFITETLGPSTLSVFRPIKNSSVGVSYEIIS